MLFSEKHKKKKNEVMLLKNQNSIDQEKLTRIQLTQNECLMIYTLKSIVDRLSIHEVISCFLTEDNIMKSPPLTLLKKSYPVVTRVVGVNFKPCFI